MGKIIGESFDDYVKNQVDIRQKKLGSFQQDNDILTYITGKTSWIRLTSGVDISEDKCKELGISTNFQGSELAKKYILFNGVASYNNDGTTTLKEGLPKGGYPGLGSSAAYGFNSAANFGLVPPPGIESIEVIPKNRGSLRTATINIKCFNREQFTIIETLFLRLKYTLLLEWGHSVYFDNGGTLVKNPINGVYKQFLKFDPSPQTEEEKETQAAAETFTGNAFTPVNNPEAVQQQVANQTVANQTRILDLIKSERKTSNGNYDGFLGWVTNFSWKLEAGNVYSITIKATTYGDIIESLSATNAVAKTTVPEGEVELIKGESSPLGLALLRFKQRMDSLGGQTTANDLKYTFGDYGKDLNQIKDIIKAANIPYDPGSSGKETFERAIVKVFDVGFFGGETVSAYYIKLGFLLYLIQNFFYKYDIKSNPNNPPPINRFAYRPGDNFIKPDNYPSTCNLTNELFSVNPKICIVPSSVSVETGGLLTSYVDLNTVSESGVPGGGTKRVISNETANLADLNDLTGVTAGDKYHFWSLKNQGKQAGLTMHIQLNIDMILQVLNENVDEEGNIAYIDFLQSILSNINKALVGVTNLTLFYDENINTYFIIDENCTLAPKSFGESDEKPTEIIIGTLKEGKGSFALEASIDSQITNKLASQLAIGAQANNQDVGANTFAISTWNAGLTDRIISSKAVNYPNNIQPQQAFESTFNKQKLGQILKRYINLSLTDEDITELQGLGKEYITVQRDIAVQSGNLASNFFIPISLNLTLDGIAGPKIFQKYTINDIILPRNYENNIEFIIKGIAHKVDRSGWTTTLESLSIPKPKDVNYISTTPSPSSSPPSSQNWISNLQKFESVNGGNTNPWSAAFISYVASKAIPSFPRAGAHAVYANFIKTLSSGWKVLDPDKEAPVIGDIIVANRSNNKNKFNSPIWVSPTHGDIVTSVTSTKMEAIGGNLSNTVKVNPFELGSRRLINRRASREPNGVFVILRYESTPTRELMAKYAIEEKNLWNGKSATNPNLPENLARRLYEYYIAGRMKPPSDATPP
jgi:hypothetical protein